MYIAMRAGVVVHVYIERSALFSAVCFWNVYACVCMRMFNKVSFQSKVFACLQQGPTQSAHRLPGISRIL